MPDPIRIPHDPVPAPLDAWADATLVKDLFRAMNEAIAVRDSRIKELANDCKRLADDLYGAEIELSNSRSANERIERQRDEFKAGFEGLRSEAAKLRADSSNLRACLDKIRAAAGVATVVDGEGGFDDRAMAEMVVARIERLEDQRDVAKAEAEKLRADANRIGSEAASAMARLRSELASAKSDLARTKRTRKPR